VDLARVKGVVRVDDLWEVRRHLGLDVVQACSTRGNLGQVVSLRKRASSSSQHIDELWVPQAIICGLSKANDDSFLHSVPEGIDGSSKFITELSIMLPCEDAFSQRY
jgi:hypothetical protein